MSNTKRKPPVMKAKQNETLNKKGLIWTGSIFGVVLIAVVVLLLVQ
ncbi:hypothetical protein [Paenibacillus protaetiae]|nr:hypothetical protein [Paenibacillus protaetiae]